MIGHATGRVRSFHRPRSVLRLEHRLLGAILATSLSVIAPPAPAQSPDPPLDDARELALLLRKLDTTERVLYVTAHPDDEDTGLLAWLTHGRGVEVALMTLTRGEGGQNEIGTELFHALGVLRSRELQAAGRYTGVTQYFSRAYEFGYSFSVEETFDKWHQPSILRDVVRVMREFRPDVVLTMLPDGPGGGQHHQASARIAAEAFEVAGTDLWPELGPPHRGRRLFRQIWNPDEEVENLCEIPLGDYDPVLGTSPAALGAESRAQHKCQGMARLTAPLLQGSSRWEWRLATDDSPHPVSDFFEGLPDPWLEDDAGNPTDLGRSVGELADRVRERYRVDDPAAILGGLLGLWDVIDAVAPATLDPDAAVRSVTLRDRIARATALAAGMRMAARAGERYVGAGQSLPVTVEMANAGPEDIELAIAVGGAGGRQATVPHDAVRFHRLAPGERASSLLDLRIRDDAVPTIARPMPLRGDELPGEMAMAVVHPAWTAFQILPTLTIRGRVLPQPPLDVLVQEVDPDFPRTFYSDPHIVPDPSVRPRRPAVAVPLTAGGSDGEGADSEDAGTPVDFLVSGSRAGTVVVMLDSPPGWRVTPSQHRVVIAPAEEETPLRFRVWPGPSPRAGSSGAPRPERLVARAHYEGDSRHGSTLGFRRVAYPHIRPGALLVPAEVRVVPFPVRVPQELHVGYVAGAGDEVREALSTLGIVTEALTTSELLEGPLDGFDVIVTGVRAYKVRDDLRLAQPRLLEWVRSGGTMILQYNKFEFNREESTSSPYAPWPGALVGRRRVTVEESPVVVNMPEHVLFTEPNLIGTADWEGWVQERGLYFLDVTDDRYQDLVTLEDPWPKNAGLKGGALVYTEVGEGQWVYVGLGLFRQLPAAVPGAYRLLANLIALGAR